MDSKHAFIRAFIRASSLRGAFARCRLAGATRSSTGVPHNRRAAPQWVFDECLRVLDEDLTGV